jgi:hypothetical protein
VLRALDHDLELAAHSELPEADHYRESARSNIRLAREKLETPAGSGARWFRRWASASLFETVSSAVHAAEADLLMVLPEGTVKARLPEIRASLTTTLEGDGRLQEYVCDLKPMQASEKLSSQHRERLRVIKSAIDATAAAANSNVRNYRNWLLIVSAVVVIGLVVAAIAHAADPEFLYIQEAKGAQGQGADVAQIEAAGAVGGLLMALFALIRLKVFSGPVALPLWQAIVRIPAGAAAGLVGALLLQGQVITFINSQTRSGLIAYAALFGAAPEIVLRFLDKQVNEATAAARNKNDPLTTVPTQAADGRPADRTATNEQ